MSVEPVLHYPQPIRTEPLKEGLFEEIVDGLASEGIYVVDRNRRILFWNGAASTISGHDAANVVGKLCSEGLLRHCDASGRPMCGDRCPLLGTMSDGMTRCASVFLLHRDGHRVPVEVRASPVRDESGRIVGSVELFHDITQPLTALEELRHARRREKLDALTGVGNRRLIEETLDAIAGSSQPVEAGVIFLDIDHFKQINDTLGHRTGDHVIRQVALTIAGELRSSDVVGRWGGEEFVVVSPGYDMQSISAMAERIRGLVAATPIPSPERPVAVTISLGVTVVQWPESAADVVERADRLMYVSKRRGRNRVTAA